MQDESFEEDCSCMKGDEAFGRLGWHFFVAPKDWCFMMNKVHEDPADRSRILCDGPCCSTRDKANCIYAGKQIAFEKCPEYWGKKLELAEKIKEMEDMEGRDAGF